LPVIITNNLTRSFGKFVAVNSLQLSVEKNEVFGLLGPNGAGKTTLLRAICAMVRATGSITFDGHELTRLRTPQIAALGVGHVPAGRGTFSALTVMENLRLGLSSSSRKGTGDREGDLARVLETFPILAEFRDRTAGQLSGGQQQMLALGRALLARPRLLLIDEPSLGLAPLVTKDLFATLATLTGDWGLSILLAEQNAKLSLELCSRAVVLVSGRVALAGPAAELSTSDLHRAYLAGAAHS
jgi:branched-chain amino acid transport system ATP-binding protein